MLWLILLLGEPSRTQWQWQNPLPQGNRLGEIQFVDEYHGWIRTHGNTVLRTTNGGLDWSDQLTGLQAPSGYILKFYFEDSLHGWGVGAGLPPVIISTEDGGLHWLSLPIPPERNNGAYYSFLDVFFLDDNIGFFGDDRGGIFRTTNGGFVWTKQYQVLNQEDIASLWFASSRRGFACQIGAVRRPLLVTSDGGSTWSSDSSVVGGSKVRFIDSLNGWILYDNLVLYGTGIARTTDGGESWTTHATPWPVQYLNHDFYFLTPLRGWLTNEKGMAATSDGGGTWQIFDSSRSYNSVLFHDLQRGWSTGGTSQQSMRDFYETTNGGISWIGKTTRITSAHLEDVDFIDADHGWIVGNSTMLSTSNGGRNWLTHAHASSWGLRDVQFISPLSGWAATGDSVVLQTLDGGESWQQFRTNTSIGVSSIHFNNSLVGWGVGGDFVASGVAGVVVQTTDGGITWQDRTPFGCGRLSSVFSFDSMRAWTTQGGGSAFDEGRLYRTTDGGVNWILQVQDANTSFENVIFVDSLFGWVGGADYILKTENGGNSWNARPRPLPGLTRLTFTDKEHGWAVSIFGETRRTTDGGESWIQHPSRTGHVLSGIDFVNDTLGWAVGNWGIIISTHDTTLTAVVEGEKLSLQPGAFMLRQNYPNPFNNSTVIPFQIQLPSARVRLQIFDLLGRVVQTVLDEPLIGGEYSVSWDGRNAHGTMLSSGLYFSRLQVGHEVGFLKMLLLR